MQCGYRPTSWLPMWFITSSLFCLVITVVSVSAASLHTHKHAPPCNYTPRFSTR